MSLTVIARIIALVGSFLLIGCATNQPVSTAESLEALVRIRDLGATATARYTTSGPCWRVVARRGRLNSYVRELPRLGRVTRLELGWPLESEYGRLGRAVVRAAPHVRTLRLRLLVLAQEDFRQLGQLDNLRELEYVTCSQNITAEEIGCIAHLGHLSTLEFSSPGSEAVDLSGLRRLRTLKELRLIRVHSLQPSDLRFLAELPHLQYVMIDGDGATKSLDDRIWNQLAGCRALREIELRNCAVTVQGAAQFWNAVGDRLQEVRIQFGASEEELQ